jgi:hypothetical protein
MGIKTDIAWTDAPVRWAYGQEQAPWSVRIEIQGDAQ